MIIKRLMRLLIFLLPLLLFSGCPYNSDIPLCEMENSVVDDSLLGSWESPEVDEDSRAVLHFLQFNAKEYLVIFTENKETSLFRAFTREIDHASFLTITEIHPGIPEPPNYIFARYHIQQDALEIRLVEEDLFEGKTFKNPEQLTKFFAMHLDNDSLYGESQTMKRISEAEMTW